jgi:hypothetical protein
MGALIVGAPILGIAASNARRNAQKEIDPEAGRALQAARVRYESAPATASAEARREEGR